MASTRRRSIKAGLPPGSMVYIGKEVTHKPQLNLITYNKDNYEIKDISSFDGSVFDRDGESVNWLNLTGLGDIPAIKEIGEHFNLHILTQEDTLNTEQRAKIEAYEGYTYIVLKMLSYNKEKRAIDGEQVSLIISGNNVITIQEFPGDVFDAVRERIKTAGTRIRKSGADFLAYALMDAVVDNYFLIIEQMGDGIDQLEEVILNRPDPQIMQQLYALKRNVILLRKSVWPLREVVAAMERNEDNVFTAGTKLFLRDLYDHTIQVLDTIESMRDIVTGLVDIYLTSINNNMSSVMKVLTIISTIFIPLTFIAGLYGMNFLFMPELGWRWAYPVVLLIMVFIGIGMLIFFKRKKWL